MQKMDKFKFSFSPNGTKYRGTNSKTRDEWEANRSVRSRDKSNAFTLSIDNTQIECGPFDYLELKQRTKTLSSSSTFSSFSSSSSSMRQKKKKDIWLTLSHCNNPILDINVK